MLGRSELLTLFEELDGLLAAGGGVHELLVVGGAALALRWEGRLSDDVDVVNVSLAPEVKAAVVVMADNRGLPTGWLNADAAAFAPNMPTGATVAYRGRHLVVRVAGGDYLLAMKLRASRDRDLDDAVVLARETGRTTRESLYELITDGYRRGTVIPDLQAFVGEVIEGLSEAATFDARDGGGSAGLDV